MIFLPTVQSTGTWFTIGFFEQHSMVDWLAPKMEWDNTRIAMKLETMVLQAHIGFRRKDAPRKKLDRPAFIKHAILEHMLDNADHVVIPIRDPLRSLLTAKVRGPDLYIRHIIEGFLYAMDIASRRDVFFLPVDLYAEKGPEERYNLLLRLLKFVDLPEEPYVALWANDWPVRNTVGRRLGSSIVLMYRERRLAEMKLFLENEYGWLFENYDNLRPFLEELGYKDLIWWSDYEKSVRKNNSEVGREGRENYPPNGGCGAGDGRIQE